MTKPKPVILCILDGWGIREAAADNAIAAAHTPCINHLFSEYPHSELYTSGLHVGLPEGQMGNSEVGHMNIGSGRIVMQDLPRIDAAIQDGSLKQHPILKNTITDLKKRQGALHMMGLLSDGGVHAHIDHMIALAKIAASEHIKVYIHAFLDGRDTAPDSAKTYITQLEQAIKAYPNIKLASIAGRYYAMDRDQRWDRVKKSYDVLTHASPCEDGADAVDVINNAYEQGIYDEFLVPVSLQKDAFIKDGDAIMCTNFRADRARQLLQALVDPHFDAFERLHVPKLSSAIGMVEYSTTLSKHLKTLFEPESLDLVLSQIVANAGLKQLKIAETEKYAHVTFFFNGGVEEPYPHEDRILIPSPDVATYDQKPEMSALEVTDALVKAITGKTYDLIVVNYANTDMVGHTGDFEAAKKAVEVIDQCMQRLVDATLQVGGAMLISADHGNAEQMKDPKTGGKHTSHTTGPVPLILVDDTKKGSVLKQGRLCDIAPTILTLMHLNIPKEMTGISLL